MNTAECLDRALAREAAARASMEPPCEHGGVFAGARAAGAHDAASMEPPCEHGGVREWLVRARGASVGFNGAAV